MEMAPLSPYDAPRLLLRVASFLAGGLGGKAFEFLQPHVPQLRCLDSAVFS